MGILPVGSNFAAAFATPFLCLVFAPARAGRFSFWRAIEASTGVLEPEPGALLDGVKDMRVRVCSEECVVIGEDETNGPSFQRQGEI